MFLFSTKEVCITNFEPVGAFSKNINRFRTWRIFWELNPPPQKNDQLQVSWPKVGTEVVLSYSMGCSTLCNTFYGWQILDCKCSAQNWWKHRLVRWKAPRLHKSWTEKRLWTQIRTSVFFLLCFFFVTSKSHVVGISVSRFTQLLWDHIFGFWRKSQRTHCPSESCRT